MPLTEAQIVFLQCTARMVAVREQYAALLAAARTVVEARAKLSFEMEPVEWTDQVFAVLLSIDALRAAIEAAGREEE
jgi:hypothetical protein